MPWRFWLRTGLPWSAVMWAVLCGPPLLQGRLTAGPAALMAAVALVAGIAFSAVLHAWLRRTAARRGGAVPPTEAEAPASLGRALLAFVVIDYAASLPVGLLLNAGRWSGGTYLLAAAETAIGLAILPGLAGALLLVLLRRPVRRRLRAALVVSLTVIALLTVAAALGRPAA